MLSDYLSVYEQTAHNFQVEHNETHIFLNEFNQNLNNVNNQTEFEGISFEDIDLTELIEIDSLSNNNQQVNAFDLSDTKLFDFISEIELITAECVDLNSPINSPLSEISHSNLIENFSSNESVAIQFMTLFHLHVHLVVKVTNRYQMIKLKWSNQIGVSIRKSPIKQLLVDIDQKN